MPEEGLMGIDIATVLGWGLTIATGVIAYILKLQNDRDKELQAQIEKIRDRIEKCERDGVRGEYIEKSLQEVKDHLDALEEKLDNQLTRLFSLFGGKNG